MAELESYPRRRYPNFHRSDKDQEETTTDEVTTIISTTGKPARHSSPTATQTTFRPTTTSQTTIGETFTETTTKATSELSTLAPCPPITSAAPMTTNWDLQKNAPRMFWIQVSLSASSLVCLIFIVCLLIAIYMIVMNAQKKGSWTPRYHNSSITRSNSCRSDKSRSKRTVDESPERLIDFRRLTLNEKPQIVAPPTFHGAQKSSPTIEHNTISESFAPVAITHPNQMEMITHEESMVRKMALDRADQEEARRHMEIVGAANKVALNRPTIVRRSSKSKKKRDSR